MAMTMAVARRASPGPAVLSTGAASSVSSTPPTANPTGPLRCGVTTNQLATAKTTSGGRDPDASGVGAMTSSGATSSSR